MQFIFFFSSCCNTVQNFYFPSGFLAQKPETQEGTIVVTVYTIYIYGIDENSGQNYTNLNKLGAIRRIR